MENAMQERQWLSDRQQLMHIIVGKCLEVGEFQNGPVAVKKDAELSDGMGRITDKDLRPGYQLTGF